MARQHEFIFPEGRTSVRTGTLRRNDRTNRRRLRMESLEYRRVLTCTLSGSEIFCESFEAGSPPGDSGLLSSGTDTPFSLSANDHWNRTNGGNIANASSGGFTNVGNTYTGQDGSFFWATEDSNADGGAAAKTLDITGIPISGFTGLSLAVRAAADGQISAGSWRFDPDDHIRFTYQIDGGGYNNILAFESDDAINSNRPIFQDTNFDGVGDGTQLVPAFGVFSNSIVGTGGLLDIRISAQSDGSSEELAFDDIRVSGTPIVTNLPPSVGASSAANVGEPEIGDTSYSFTVTYSDNSAVDVSTIGTADVTVTGPGGPLAVTGATEPTGTDGSPRTATYTVTPPGGSWDSSDNGVYSISVNANEVGDDGSPQLFAAAGLVTSFSVNATNTPPVITNALALDVINSDLGDTSYSFEVEYSDVGGIDVSSIGANDVTVTGPGGPLTVTGATVDIGTDGSPRTATYTVTPPGGSWDVSDVGAYTIGIAASQVLDVVGASVAANASAAVFQVAPNQLLNESFESNAIPGDSGLVTFVDSPFSLTPNDHWNRTDGSNIANASSGGFTNTSNTYVGQDGSYFWATEDSNADGGGAARTIDITGINIAGFDSLQFNGLFAADGQVSAGIWRYDLDDHIRISYQIDGGGFQNLLAFESDSSLLNNRPILQDTNFDGVGDGAQLVPGFAGYTAGITGTGSTLDLRISAQSDDSSEELAFDSLMVTGNPIAGNTAPTVSSFAAADVGEPEIGNSSYSFTVTYSDNSAIDVGTIDTSDVTVTGPGGPLTVTGATEPTGTNGAPRTATYTVTPPGGTWDAGDNGTYTIGIVGSQVGDDGLPQLFVAADPALTTFNVDATNTPPVVTNFLALDVIAADFGQTVYNFTVEYSDVGGVDVSSIDANDVTVTGPGGPLTVTGASVDIGTDGSPRTATYSVQPPSTFWDAGDAGTYTIGVVGSEIFDVVGAAVAANPTLTTFEVLPDKLFNESFETSAIPGDSGLVTGVDSPFSLSPDDHWNRTDGGNIANASSGGFTNVGNSYVGQDRAHFWATEDSDADGGSAARTIDITGINIAGYTNLAFAALVAADGQITPGSWRFDPDDHMRFSVQIDGGGFQNVLSFESASSTLNNQPMLQDTDFDGVGDGTQITPTFGAFGVTLAGTGTTMDLRISVQSDGASEELAFDSLMVTGDLANTPPTVTLVGAALANEGDTLTYSYTTVDAEGGPFTLLGQSCGAAGVLSNDTFNPATGAGSFDCTFADGPDSSTVSVQVEDSVGAPSNVDTIVVTINNVAPTVTLSGPAVVDVGDTATYSYTTSDPGNDTFVQLTESCGVNGVISNPSFTSATGAGSFDCTFPLGPASSTVSVQVADSDGAPSNVDSIAVTINGSEFVLIVDDPATVGVDVIVVDNALAGAPTAIGPSTHADANTTLGAASFSGAVGAFPVVVASAVGKPLLTGSEPEIQLSGVAVNSGPGTLDFGTTDTGFSVPAGLHVLTSPIGGVTDSNTVQFVETVDLDDNQFAIGSTSFAQTSQLLPGPGAFSGTDSVSIVFPGTTFSLTKLVSFTHIAPWRVSGFGAGGTINQADVASRVVGDSNLDGVFDSSDLVRVFQTNKYDKDVEATFQDGDWNFDGRFDSADLVFAFKAGTYGAPRPDDNADIAAAVFAEEFFVESLEGDAEDG